MQPKNKARYEYKQVWSWPDDVEQFIKGLIKGRSLHVCCGDSMLGDVKVDKYIKRDDVCNADALDLPFENEFDTVICDPPWEFPYHTRHRLLYSLRDALKPNGILIFNSFWLPKVRGLKIEDVYCGFPKSAWRSVSLIFIARKINEVLEVN